LINLVFFYLLILYSFFKPYFLALLRLRNYDEDQVEQELNEFEEEKQRLSQLAKVKWLDFVYVKALRRPLIVAIVLQCTQQFSGINAVIFYSTQIFIDAGLDGDLPVYATIAIGNSF